MNYGVKYQYYNDRSYWGFSALSFANKCKKQDGTFMTNDINEAYKYLEELRLFHIKSDIVWWVEERQ